jgi:hypothetical protein
VNTPETSPIAAIDIGTNSVPDKRVGFVVSEAR